MNQVLWPMIGGLLIGLASILLFMLLGRIAGISGIIWGSITCKQPTERQWRWLFLAGIVLGTFLFHALSGTPAPRVNDNYILAALAGLFVGVGVKLGNGCTSGHGVCGIGRLSARSLAATATFMLVAIITVAVFSSFKG